MTTITNKLQILTIALLLLLGTGIIAKEIDKIDPNDSSLKLIWNYNVCPELGNLNKSEILSTYIKFNRIYYKSHQRSAYLDNLENESEYFKVVSTSQRLLSNEDYEYDTYILDPEKLNFYDAKNLDNKEKLVNFLKFYNAICGYEKDFKPGYYNQINFTKEFNKKINFMQKININEVLILHSYDYYQFMVYNFDSRKHNIKNDRILSDCGLPFKAPYYNYCYSNNYPNEATRKSPFDLNRIYDENSKKYKDIKFLTSIKLFNFETDGTYDFENEVFTMDLTTYFPELYSLDKAIIIPELKLKIKKENMEKISQTKGNSIRILFKINSVNSVNEEKKYCVNGFGGNYCESLGICQTCYQYKKETIAYRRIKISPAEVILIDSDQNTLYQLK